MIQVHKESMHSCLNGYINKTIDILLIINHQKILSVDNFVGCSSRKKH